MGNDNEYTEINDLQQEQMLKLITKGFYDDLINYGIDSKDIITVSTHLLDYLIETGEDEGKSSDYYNRYFTLNSIKDEWNNRKRFSIDNISISPLGTEMYPRVESWLRNPAIKYSFISMFPESVDELNPYFDQADRTYFGIFYNNEHAGVIGAENIDNVSRKLEMRKFVGDNSQGKGIGKRATFLFLYYVFVIMKFNKVYIHSKDTNIRNIKLNSKFGFVMEGIFFEDVFLEDKMRDVVRMGLLRSKWDQIFSDA